MSGSEKVAVYTSDITGKEVFLNLDPRHFQWVHVPTESELQELVAEWERVRIGMLWKRLAEPLSATTITAFRTVGIGSLVYFKRNVVIDAFGFKVTGVVKQVAPYIQAQSLERQVEVLNSIKPSTFQGLGACIGTKTVAQLFPVDLATLIMATGGVENLVAKAQIELATNTVPRHHSSSYRELLMMLRARGWLLYPAEYHEWTGGNVRWRPFYHKGYAGPVFSMFDEMSAFLSSADGGRTERSGIGLIMLAVTSATSIEDLSRDLIDAAEKVMCNVQLAKDASGAYAKRRPGCVRTAAVSFREMWNRRFPAVAFTTTRTQIGQTDSALLRTRGEYGWVRAERPEMEAWVKPLAVFIVERKGGRTKGGPISDLNWFLDFLIALPNPPLHPEDTERHLHIHDPTLVQTDTLMTRLSTSGLTSKRLQRILRITREFFSWYQDWLHANGRADVARTFVNPVTEFERMSPDNAPQGTHRQALPSWVMNELRRTLMENDFEMPKRAFRADWVPVFDSVEGCMVRTWWPGVATSLCILLDVPLRSHQVRWLDSGEFDELVCDANAKRNVKNSSIQAMRGRREGALRLFDDSLSEARWLGLYINTNKTALYDGVSPNGYEIPWVSERTAGLISAMVSWNQRYLSPLSKLVTYDNEGLGKSAFAKVNQSFLPRISPLLRDPKNSHSNVPVTRTKIARLWVAVLHETEKRVRIEKGIPNFELTVLNEQNKRVWKFDIHTLRVSGISAMLENGVPLEVVSQFIAGHATLAMTFWYQKFAPAKLREKIEHASNVASDERDFIGSESFMDHIEEFSPFLLSKESATRHTYDPAYVSLKEHTGIWTVNTDGICPGTSCSTGGEKQPGAAEYEPVRGGKRCGLCRYWLTGPAFLLGQMAAANNLAYEIRNKGLALSALRDELIELEDADQRTRARHVRDQIQLKELELEVDIAEWYARYNYAITSSKLADDYVQTRNRLGAASQLPVPVITTSTADDLKVTLREADEFILLEHVTQTSEFMPEFRHHGAMQDKHVLLSQMLAANGIPAKYLVTLTPKQRDVAANLMSSTMLNYVEAQDMRRFASGELLLKDVAGLEPAMRELAAADTLLMDSVKPRKTIPIRAV